VQNLHQHRAFLLQSREELRTNEANKRSELLSNIAYTDRLTDIPNRRYFDEIVETLHAQSGDTLPLSLCLIDIDHFKQLNDQLGHLQGDRCLRLVAACLHHNMRDKNDVLARYGGEEFVILLPGTTAEQAWVIADRMRHAIMELNHPNPGTASGVVTVSMGLATAEEGPLQIEFLLREADEALYRAKANGRNKVEA
jgi:diguanylate cyclase (GGDEF)-like protein